MVLGACSPASATSMAGAGDLPPARAPTTITITAARRAQSLRLAKAAQAKAAHPSAPALLKPPPKNRFVPAAPAFKSAPAEISVRHRSANVAGVIGGPSSYDAKKAALVGGSVMRHKPH